jgi:hypothetical protein
MRYKEKKVLIMPKSKPKFKYIPIMESYEYGTYIDIIWAENSETQKRDIAAYYVEYETGQHPWDHHEVWGRLFWNKEIYEGLSPEDIAAIRSETLVKDLIRSESDTYIFKEYFCVPIGVKELFSASES